jgi:hypothetical protein
MRARSAIDIENGDPPAFADGHAKKPHPAFEARVVERLGRFRG